MSEESKCACQRCGQHIAFPAVMHGQDIACPHCGKSTTLLIPSLRIRKAEPSTAEQKDYSEIGAAGIVFSILLPFIGFFIGIYLMAKGQSGRGCACMGISIIAGIGWLALFSSFSS